MVLEIGGSSSATQNGAATSAKQDTGNTSLASLDSKTPALGAAVAAASQPVTLATNDVLLGRIGEVQASPTANTLLDRLKTVATNVGNLATSIVLAAGENHLGAVGGNTASLIKPLTVSTSAYVAGHCVGGLITLTGALRTGGPLTGLLQSVLIADKSNQKAALDILVFTSLPAATFTDHAAFPTLTQADALLVRRRVSIAAVDYVTVGGSAFADISAIGKVLSGAATTLYAAIVTTGTPTYANATDLQVTFGILQD